MFSIYKSANSMKRKQLALLTALFCPYMELLCRVSRGKTGEANTEEPDYRHRCPELRKTLDSCHNGSLRFPARHLDPGQVLTPGLLIQRREV